ncbi:MAG: hypothetical protein AAF532_01620 [Planctomycetota bacterium]
MKFLYFIPLAVAISCVYCGTRYERPAVIVRRSAGFLGKTLGFMVLLYAILYAIARLV